MKKRIAILGSTGSIGINTLDVISLLRGSFSVMGLAAESNVDLLARQARAFRPKIVSIGDHSRLDQLRRLVPPGTAVVSGEKGLREIVARSDADIIVLATSGMSCLVPLMDAVRLKKHIALANKESLVSAGPTVMRSAARSGARIIPVDSEHSAIFQCLDGNRSSPVRRIYLTASGGPLLNIDSRKFDSLPRDFILRHPKWRMGRKISVDSATMMNKGLEILEAKYLFGVDEARIEVLIHPEAIVHSMVEFCDGSVLAQLALPDMRLPIQYALTYPERLPGHIGHVEPSTIGTLEFRKPDTGKFPCLGLARQAARSGGTAPVVLCAADEEAVARYLDGDIKFSHISKIIAKVLSRHNRYIKKEPTIGDIVDAGRWAKEEARSLCCH